MGYYCQFILKFVQVAQPLHKLMCGENAGKKQVAVIWNDRCQQLFDELKCLYTIVPIFAYTHFTKPLKWHTIASGSGLGAVLYHSCDDSTDAITTYTSRSLTKAEPTTLPINWSFLPLSGLWSRNFINTFTD